MTSDKLRAAIDNLADPQQRIYFFERLTNPSLFDRLKQMGLFKEPPLARYDEGRLSFVVWPQAKYLINVAEAIPDKVALVLRSIETTDNALVAFDLMSAALAMPASHARNLVANMERWFSASPEMLVDRYVRMVVRLAENQSADTALRLCSVLLEVVPGRETKFEALNYRSVDAEARITDGHYSWVIERVSKALLPACPSELIALLSRKLQDALGIESRTEGRDMSSTWIPDLEKKPLAHGAKETLAYNLFASCDTALSTRLTRLSEICDLLSSIVWDVFDRIRVALIAKHGDLDDARSVLAWDKFFSSHELARERGLLLVKVYPGLSKSEKDDVLLHLRSGLVAKERLRDFYSQRLSGQELEDAITAAQDRDLFEELQPLEAVLTDDHAALFSHLKERFGGEDDEPKNGEVWVGPTAPKSLEDFQRISTPEILSFLETWTPSPGWFKPSPEGVGRTLKPLIAARAAEFLAASERIHGLAPTYVRHIVDAIRPHAVAADLDHASFLNLLDYGRLADRKTTIAKYAAWDESDEEESWAPTRQTIAFAISDMLRASALPIHFRERVWAILESIIQDDDPTPEHDAKYAGDSSYGHPWNLALNSARGAGMLAVFDYARWLYRSTKSEKVDLDLFDEAPELFQALNHRLAVDPTRAIRSAYGQNFVSIYVISRSWGRPAAERIFSNDALGDAAWNAYLVFNGVYSEIFELLKGRYDTAVANVASAPEERTGDWYPAGSLGSHLTGPFAWGRLDLSSGSMFGRFLRDAPPSALKQSLRSIGNALHSSEALDAATVQRFKDLYEYILALYEMRPIEERKEVLGIFGLWFFSEQLDAPWALSALLQTLQLTDATIDFDFRVLERLAIVSPSYSIEAVSILNRMLDTGLVFHFMNSDSVRVILSTAVNAGGDAYQIAVGINNRLCNMGVLGYRDAFPTK